MYTDRFNQPVTLGARGTFYFGNGIKDGVVERIIPLVPHPNRANLLCREDMLRQRDPAAWPILSPEKAFLAFMRPEVTGHTARAVPASHLMLRPGV